jgi:hypothetical protein
MVPPPSMLPPGWQQQAQQQQQQAQQAPEHALSSADSVVGAPPTFYGTGPPVQWGNGFAPLPIGAPTKGPEAPTKPSLPGQPPSAAAAPDAVKAGQQQQQVLTPAMLASLQLAQQSMPNHSQAFPMHPRRPVPKEVVVTPLAPSQRG